MCLTKNNKNFSIGNGPEHGKCMMLQISLTLDVCELKFVAMVTIVLCVLLGMNLKFSISRPTS
jgi:hypothetical protein